MESKDVILADPKVQKSLIALMEYLESLVAEKRSKELSLFNDLKTENQPVQSHESVVR